MNRRGFLAGILAAGYAPAIGHAGILMPVKKIVEPAVLPFRFSSPEPAVAGDKIFALGHSFTVPVAGWWAICEFGWKAYLQRAIESPGSLMLPLPFSDGPAPPPQFTFPGAGLRG